MRQGPLAGRYPFAAAMVVFALVPYLALSGALGPITPTIASQLHMSLQTFSLGSGLANAAYAVGTVISVQFAALLPQRRMMVLYALVLVIGSVLTAAAQNAPMFIVGHILQGLCTSLLLIAAAPALFLGYPRSRMRSTVVIMDMGIFGAVALGPLIGRLQAGAHGWRPLFWIVAGVSLAALALSVLTFEDAPPADLGAPRDPVAIGLAASGSAAAFFGASELFSHRFLGPLTILPLLVGLALILTLIVSQSLKQRPLLTIRSMLTSTIPVAGIVIALFAAAASVSAIELTSSALSSLYSPLHLGLLYLPEFAGAVITGLALGVVFDKKGLHYLPLAGMGFLAAGILVFRIEIPPTQTLTLIGSGLTGIGVGATVAPALFAAGFSLQSQNLQRVFAIVELMRAVAAFMIAPVFAHFVATVGGGRYGGLGTALWIGAGLAIAGGVIALALYVVNGARPQKPDLDTFLAGEAPAWFSPPLLVHHHRRAGREIPEPAGAGDQADGAAGDGASGDGAAGSQQPSTSAPAVAEDLSRS